MIGKEILNYKIERLIGEGGMGTVYLAVNSSINQQVAIKSLAPQFVYNNQIVRRFKREAATLAKLNHPNIVKLLNFYEDERGLFLIMEYVEGHTLDQYIENISGPILETKAIKMFKGILDAFEFAHNQGIIHRDIKPSNIIITNNDEVKVFDFGIAKIIDEPENQKLTQTGTKIGTIAYMSPEQIKQGNVNRLSDIYALGVVLHQMLTGKPPYNSIGMSEFDISAKIVYELLPRAKSIYPHVSDKMQAIIDKATEKLQNNRYSSCNEFNKALLSGNTSESSKLKTPSELTEYNIIEDNYSKINYLLKYKIIPESRRESALRYFNSDLGLDELDKVYKAIRKAVFSVDEELNSITDFEMEMKVIRTDLLKVLDNLNIRIPKVDLDLFEKLNQLIENASYSFFGGLNKELVKFMRHIFIDHDKSIELIEKYRIQYREDLIKKIMKISTRYDRIERYLEIFINQGIVEAKYPHARIEKL